jgi:N-methylhydantoinase A
VYARDLLPAGTQFDGPLIVEQMDATTVVPPKSQFRVDATGTMHLTLDVAQKPQEAA